MSARTLTTGQILDMLASAAVRIESAAMGLTPAQLHQPPEEDSWSVNDILAHLRACADVWGGCIARILAEDHPTIRAIDPRTWMAQTDYPQQPFDSSFRIFSAQRSDLIETLQALDPDQWNRSSTVTGAGKPLERTVKAYAGRLVVHERSHLKQIERAARDVRS